MYGDGRIRFSIETRSRAADLFASGLGYKATATKLKISNGTVKDWYYTYRMHGKARLLEVTKNKRTTYTYEQKIGAVTAIIEDGATYLEAMKMFGINSKHPLERWVKAYRESGPEALVPKKRGRPKIDATKPKIKTYAEELEQRVFELEFENLVLKKLKALSEENETWTGQ